MAQDPLLELRRLPKTLYDKLINQLLNPDDPNAYFQAIVTINEISLYNYYSLVEKQAKKSFIFAAVACFLGFVLIVTPIAFDLKDLVIDTDLSKIVTYSGIVVELISGLFFYLYSRTVEQLKKYHDNLVYAQDVLLSFKLVETVKEEANRILIIQDMIHSLTTIEEKRQALM